MTGLKMLEAEKYIMYCDIKSLLRPFRRLKFPIMTDKPESTSLFTQAGQDRFADGIRRIADVYVEHVGSSGIEIRLLEIPEDDVFDSILYSDDYQALVDKARFDELRGGILRNEIDSRDS